MTLKVDRRQRVRVRCSDCGSTRVRGITEGYLDGPLSVDDDGRVYVSEGEWTAHDEHVIAGASVLCLNCGGGRYRVENAGS